MKYTAFIFAIVLFLTSVFAQADIYSNYSGKSSNVSVLIANTTTTSVTVPMKGAVLVGLLMPAAFTGTTVTFLAASSTAGPFVPVFSTAGAAVSYTVAASRYVAINPLDFYGVQFLQIVSGTAEAADRNIILSARGM